MALFKGSYPVRDNYDPSTGKLTQSFRSNTKLQAGTHDAPGEKFFIDPRLAGKFRYHFGGAGEVVIPKGIIVAPATTGDTKGTQIVDGQIVDPDTGFKVGCLTIANGGADVSEAGPLGDYTRKANKPIGVAYGNLYQQFVYNINYSIDGVQTPGGWTGMQPTIENEIYIELPLLESESDADKIHWGCAYGEDLKPGDYVMSDTKGRFIKADFETLNTQIGAAADLAALKAKIQELNRMNQQVIGQVWAVEKYVVPAGQVGQTQSGVAGWLKWVQWSQEDQMQDDLKMNNSGFRPEDIATQDTFPGYPFTPTYANYDFKTNKYDPKGIPGLTNGSNIEVPKTEKIGTIKAGQTGNYYFHVKSTPIVKNENINNNYVEIAAMAGLTFTVDHVDPERGLVVVNVTANASTADHDVVATFKATGQIPGLPTNMDFKGSIGAIRILLQK